MKRTSIDVQRRGEFLTLPYSIYVRIKQEVFMANYNLSFSMRFRTKFVMTAVFFVLFAAIAANFFKISVVNNKKYQAMANSQHFGSITISAHRGTIFDAKGNALAKSATVYKVYLDPSMFKTELEELQKRIDKRNNDKKNGDYKPEYDDNGVEKNALPESAYAFTEETVAFLAEKLKIEPDKVRKAMEEDTQYSVLQDQVEKPVADEVLSFFNKYGMISLAVEEDTKRYYPQSELAASVIGFTTADGNGIYGVEAYYDEYLSGIDGRTISAKDSNGNELPYRYSKTYDARNGDDVYLTIDMIIQYTLEQHLQEMVEEHKVKNRGCAILMNAKTGEIYGMAQYPNFDLNNPYKIDEAKEAEIKAQKNEAKADSMIAAERETQWRNKNITEVYEPGSVFKVITSAAAFEENLIDTVKDRFYCTGSVKLEGHADEIRCHDRSGHGTINYQTALTKSCNPAFMEIGKRLGIEKFAYYLEAFGFDQKTGIDLPAESRGVIKYADEMDHVDLAVFSFGQGETVTPIEMITSYCAAINGGYLLQPYVVDKIVDENGNIVLQNERTVRRQVISEETSAKMRDALFHVVEDNNGGNVSIKGYSIGGKSGTAQRISVTSPDEEITEQGENSELQEYAASYVCFTPADDPEIILLVMADMPDKANNGYYGSVVAVPTARDILTDVLPYLGISPEYSDDELQNLDVKIPLLEGSLDDAKKTLEGLGMKYEVIGNGIEVVAQSPQTGTAVAKNGCVYLYTEQSHTADYTTVPDLTGGYLDWANEQLTYCQLNYVARGAMRSEAVVSGQSIPPGTEVKVGTTIELEFTVYESGD